MLNERAHICVCSCRWGGGTVAQASAEPTLVDIVRTFANAHNLAFLPKNRRHEGLQVAIPCKLCESVHFLARGCVDAGESSQKVVDQCRFTLFEESDTSDIRTVLGNDKQCFQHQAPVLELICLFRCLTELEDRFNTGKVLPYS